jgi:galactose mutarotase-like enzyme
MQSRPFPSIPSVVFWGFRGKIMTDAEQEYDLILVGSLSLTIAPHLGGKIASIRIKGRELLQAPLIPCGPRTRTMPFDAGDASGWDECMPSVAGCQVEMPNGPATIPDHGDLWRVAWQQLASSAGSAAFRGECLSLPLALERTLKVAEVDKGWRLGLDYKVTNIGSYPAPWSWAAHPLFAVEAGDYIVLPDSIHSLRLEGSGGGRLGETGATVLWPVANLANGGKTDLSKVLPRESAIGDKLFAGPLGSAENWCALERTSSGVRITVHFAPAATPYLGLWICYGGWPDRPGPKQMCVALEPATAPVDSLAETGPWSRVLAPGASFSWPVTVEFESISGL